MTIERLRLRAFRCFETADWQPGQHWTLISGENASGKTSLLEAVFFLGRGRSFRTARTEKLIQQGAEAFEVVANLSLSRKHRLGVRRAPRESNWRLDGQALGQMSRAASLLPVLSIDSNAQMLIEGGPEYRRRFLDWGLFHVEQSFLSLWRRYRQALSQRNGALRTGSPDRLLASWDQALATAGEALHQARLQQLARLNAVFGGLAVEGLGLERVELRYLSGWKDKASLLDCLAANHDGERRAGYSLHGPHRAEVQILVDGIPARERVSRGQQKMLAACLLLAGARVYEELRDQGVVVLVDDLPSELDRLHAQRLSQLLMGLRGQCFISGIDLSSVAQQAPTGTAMFHVEQHQLIPA